MLWVLYSLIETEPATGQNEGAFLKHLKYKTEQVISLPKSGWKLVVNN